MYSAKDFHDQILAQVKAESLNFVRSIFETPEQLKNIDLILNKEIRSQQENEGKLQTILSDHMQNLKSSIQELKAANIEASILESQMNEIKSICSEFKKLEGGLDKLIKFSKSYSANTQSVNLLNQLLTMNDTLQSTFKFIDELNFLPAHKNIIAMEALRDKIFSKYLDSVISTTSDPSQAIEKWPVSKNFEQVNALNKKMFDQIINVFTNLFKFASDDPVALVSTMRIVMREEAIDEYWRKQRSTKQNNNNSVYIPLDRPKAWFSQLEPIIVSGIKENLDDLKKDIDFTTNKHGITEYFARITKSLYSILITVQDDIVPAFPPSYNIMKLYMSNYHNFITEIIKHFIEKFGDDTRGTEIIGILMFERDYYGSDLYSNVKFDPPLIPLIKKYKPILDPNEKSKLEKLYISRVYNMLDGKVNRIIKLEVQTWKGSQPPIIIDGRYFSLTYTFYNDFVGVHLSGFSNNFLSSELHWGVFKSCLTAFETFTNKYSESFDEYALSNFPPAQNLSVSTSALSTINSFLNIDRAVPQSKPSPESDPYFSQFCMAICNNTKEISNALHKACDQFQADIKKSEDLVTGVNFQTNASILGQNITNRVLAIENTLQDITAKCSSYICNDFVRELTSAFDELFSKNWRLSADEWSQGLQGAMEGFLESINHLSENNRLEVIKKIDLQLAVYYLNSFFTQKSKYSYEESVKYGDIMQNDGIALDEKMCNFVKIETKTTWCYSLSAIASVFKTPDQTCATIDLFNLFKMYSDFTTDHAFTILRLRNDFSKDSIVQIINDSSANVDIKGNRKFGLFVNIKLASSR